MNEFETKQLKDRVALAMCACDSANRLKVRTTATVCQLTDTIKTITPTHLSHFHSYLSA